MRRVAPSADRNKEAIAEILREVLPRTGVLLEIASGTGQHAAFFAARFPDMIWQPSDVTPAALDSIRSYADEAGLANLRHPVYLDVIQDAWPVTAASGLVCINMIHIAPWQACLGLLRGAKRILPPGGPLVLYGPFAIDGDLIAPSNVDFDQRLRTENSTWGIRELRDVQTAAADADLFMDRCVLRPANNHVVVFRRAGVP